MTTEKYAGYADEALQPFTEKLLNEYYESLEALCTSARSQAERVNVLETDTMAFDYAMLSKAIIDEIKEHVSQRKAQLVPYVQELAGKVATNHNCAACSGGCKLNHEMRIVELTTSNERARKVLHRLRLATLPLYSHTMYPDEYRILRNRLALLEMNMTELFFLENTYLIPKITNAQKVINASNS